MTAAFERASRVIADGLAARVYSAAAAETGTSGGADWHQTFGRTSHDADARDVTGSTLFDLASLTKVISTTSIAMRLTRDGRLDLHAPVSQWMPEWSDGPYSALTVRNLLDHSSGLPAWLPLYQHHTGREAFREAIAAVPPEYPPGTKSVYSDLGFITLGHVIESVARQRIDALFESFRNEAALPETLRYGAAPGHDVAATEQDPWRGRVLRGEVHDENAAALGGVAPHAGLFGTAHDAGAFARLVLRTFREVTPLGTPSVMKLYAARTGVPDSSRALGWDTMLPSSSCGSHMSAAAIGHTGFTGTSLWIDPARDRYFVLLTNRVHPTREDNSRIREVRRAFHDALLTAAPAS
jgi:serine-type D-Ala-D-Ala carboxypeptidase